VVRVDLEVTPMSVPAVSGAGTVCYD